MDRAIERIRRFNRFYTNQIGILNRHILDSPLSLSEARVLFEVNNQVSPTARSIMQTLDIDEGYLSRILQGFIKQGFLKKARNDNDKRSFVLTVTPKGKTMFMKINQASDEGISKMIVNLDESDIRDLVSMMEGIEKILLKTYEKGTPG